MKRRFVTTLLLLAPLLFPATAQPAEEILEFHSDIQLRRDGSMAVEEHIRIRAEGNKIKRGIYRDFPTTYRDRFGNRVRINFQLMGVSRDGRPESYHTEQRSNGIRIYAGQKRVFLKPGEYQYTLRYQTSRQLGHFEERDELYWNVTGNGWDFPINKASAIVRLPAGVADSDVKIEGYTGPQGARGQAFRGGVENGQAWFQTLSPLRRHEGLTIVATWPGGLIVRPDLSQRLHWLWADNKPLLIAVSGIALVLAYYLISWFRVGRDPRPGTIIPRYRPPDGYSPAALRFINKMGYDNQTLSAALVNMAVRGYLRINEDAQGTFTLTKTGEMPRLAAGEGAIASALFGSGNRSIALDSSNHQRISKAVKAHKRALRRDYEKTYFLTNSVYLVPGALLSALVIGAALVTLPEGDRPEITGFMTVWLAFWSVGVFALGWTAWGNWRSALSTGSGYAKAIGTTLFAVPFFAGEVFGLIVLFTQGAPMLATLLLILVAINFLFYQWLKAPTWQGRKLLDRALGFNLYLSVAEKDELNFRHPPKKTPELFERYLPFAIALGVEQRWAERFVGVLTSAGLGGTRYAPSWYHGRSWSHTNLAGFGSAMGHAMSSAIASSSSPPGSSSGSGGGGSSGGGGGGGGGGGW
ncbi:MAG: DUF2207 domain-containing protein [Gammaproteobacteria bacterium]|nr:DUF2207 domain-containing protein [Gammaproteobacteria bacterium]